MQLCLGRHALTDHFTDNISEVHDSLRLQKRFTHNALIGVADDKLATLSLGPLASPRPLQARGRGPSTRAVAAVM